MNNLLWLEDWYRRQCDGVWEQSFGIHIQTLDKPGWQVRIELKGTRYDLLPNAELKRLFASETEWMVCRLVAGTFEANGGPLMLGPMLQVFRSWVETVQ